MPKCIYARCKREVPDGASFCPFCGRKQVKEKKKKTRRERGTGSVYKVSGDRHKPWAVQINRKTLGEMFRTKAEAEAALEQALGMAHPDYATMTVEEVYNRWFELAKDGVSASTIRNRKCAWANVPDEVKKMTACRLKSDDIRHCIDCARDKKLGHSSQANILGIMSELCKWMMERDMINKNYARFVKIDPQQKKEIITFTPEEIAKISLEADGEKRTRSRQAAQLTMILLFTGMRISELFELKIENIFLYGEIPYIIGGKKTKAGKNRKIPIYPRISKHIRYFCDTARGETISSALWFNTTPDGWRKDDYYPMLDGLGIPRKAPHSARKTLATASAHGGMDESALVKIMGWSDISVAHKYYIGNDFEWLSGQLETIAGWDEKIAEKEKRLKEKKEFDNGMIE